MKASTEAMSNLSKVAYRAFQARLRDAHAFQASMELIHGGEGPVLSGGGRASWPVHQRDRLRAKFVSAFEDLDLSAALWLAAGSHQTLPPPPQHAFRRRSTWDAWRKLRYEGKA